MDAARTLIAWVLFLIMALAAGFFWHQSAGRAALINDLRTTVAGLEGQINQLKENTTALEAQIMALQARRYGSDDDEATREMPSQPEEAPASFSLGDLLDSLKGENDQQAVGGDALSAMMELFDSPQGDSMLEAGINMAMDMQFGDFLELFPPDTMEAVRQILADFSLKAAREGIGAFGSGRDFDAMAASMETSRGAMLEELRAVIGDDGVAMYEQYEKELPARMLDQSLEMQLGMYARGLDPETRDLVRHTIVEELIALQPDDSPRIPTSQTMQVELQMQDEAYGRALERLEPLLTDEEYNVVHRFVEQQQQMSSMVESMMGIGGANQ